MTGTGTDSGTGTGIETDTGIGTRCGKWTVKSDFEFDRDTIEGWDLYYNYNYGS